MHGNRAPPWLGHLPYLASPASSSQATEGRTVGFRRPLPCLLSLCADYHTAWGRGLRAGLDHCLSSLFLDQPWHAKLAGKCRKGHWTGRRGLRGTAAQELCPIPEYCQVTCSCKRGRPHLNSSTASPRYPHTVYPRRLRSRGGYHLEYREVEAEISGKKTRALLKVIRRQFDCKCGTAPVFSDLTSHRPP